MLLSEKKEKEKESEAGKREKYSRNNPFTGGERVTIHQHVVTLYSIDNKNHTLCVKTLSMQVAGGNKLLIVEHVACSLNQHKCREGVL